MSNRNKEKGKGVEREVAAIFSNAFKQNFQRVPNSGAFIGGKNVERMNKLSANQTNLFKGDIIPPDDMPNLIIECKGRKVFSFNLLFDDCIELNSWIDQVEIDYNAVGRKGLYFIVFKINNKGFFVCYLNNFMISNDDDKRELNCLIYNYKENEYIIHRFSKEWLVSNMLNIRELSK